MNWHWFIEKPRTRSELIMTRIVKFVILLALVITGVVWVLNTDKADAASISTTQYSDPRMPADPPYWAPRAARKFNHHRLDNSHGRIVPAVAVHHLRHYRSNHPSVRPWWKRGLDFGQCMFNSIGSPIWTVAWQSLCLVDGEKPSFRHINENITAVRVVCGGAAVVGFLKGGGEWGAVKSSAKCAFPMAVAIYENWLDRPIHTRGGRTLVPKS